MPSNSGKEEKIAPSKLKVEEVDEEVTQETSKDVDKKEELTDKAEINLPEAGDTPLSSFKLADIEGGKSQEDENTKSESTMSEKASSQPSTSAGSKTWLNDVESQELQDTALPEKKGSGKRAIFIVFALIVLGGLIGGGIYYYQTNLKKNTNEIKKENVVILEPQTTPTPAENSGQASESAEVELANLKVQILNGSGVAGEASYVSEKLVSLGFDQENIETDNADSYEYVETLVSTKETLPESIYDQIKEALSDDYVVNMNEEFLPNSSDFDIELIVGKKN